MLIPGQTGAVTISSAHTPRTSPTGTVTKLAGCIPPHRSVATNSYATPRIAEATPKPSGTAEAAAKSLPAAMVENRGDGEVPTKTPCASPTPPRTMRTTPPVVLGARTIPPCERRPRDKAFASMGFFRLPSCPRCVPALAELPHDGRNGARPRTPHGRVALVPHGDLDPLPGHRDDPRAHGDPRRGPPIPHGAAGLRRGVWLELRDPHGPRPGLRVPHVGPGPPRGLGRHGRGAVRDRRRSAHVNLPRERPEHPDLDRPPVRRCPRPVPRHHPGVRGTDRVTNRHRDANAAPDWSSDRRVEAPRAHPRDGTVAGDGREPLVPRPRDGRGGREPLRVWRSGSRAGLVRGGSPADVWDRAPRRRPGARPTPAEGGPDRLDAVRELQEPRPHRAVGALPLRSEGGDPRDRGIVLRDPLDRGPAAVVQALGTPPLAPKRESANSAVRPR